MFQFSCQAWIHCHRQRHQAMLVCHSIHELFRPNVALDATLIVFLPRPWLFPGIPPDDWHATCCPGGLPEVSKVSALRATAGVGLILIAQTGRAWRPSGQCEEKTACRPRLLYVYTDRCLHFP